MSEPQAQQQTVHERRWKKIPVPFEYIQAVMEGINKQPRILAIPELELPDGWRIVQMFYETCNCCCSAIIEHPSFESVPEGQVIPPLNAVYKFHYEQWPPVRSLQPSLN